MSTTHKERVGGRVVAGYEQTAINRSRNWAASLGGAFAALNKMKSDEEDVPLRISRWCYKLMWKQYSVGGGGRQSDWMSTAKFARSEAFPRDLFSNLMKWWKFRESFQKCFHSSPGDWHKISGRFRDNTGGLATSPGRSLFEVCSHIHTGTQTSLNPVFPKLWVTAWLLLGCETWNKLIAGKSMHWDLWKTS